MLGTHVCPPVLHSRGTPQAGSIQMITSSSTMARHRRSHTHSVRDAQHATHGYRAEELPTQGRRPLPARFGIAYSLSVSRTLQTKGAVKAYGKALQREQHESPRLQSWEKSRDNSPPIPDCSQQIFTPPPLSPFTYVTPNQTQTVPVESS